MAFAPSASGRWSQMDAERSDFLRRCEQYAFYTLPKLCPPIGFNPMSDDLSHDFQSVGAQSVNHLANKLMLASFAPSRPFFRLDATPEIQAQLASLEVPETEVTDKLAEAEREACKVLDRKAIRPKLFEAFKNLIVLGNVLLILDDHHPRVVGIRKFCVRRSNSGAVLELMIAERVVFDELDTEVQATLLKHTTIAGDREVTLYKWIRRNAAGDYELEQWVDNWKLPKKFNGRWPYDKLPYRVLTWDLADGAHYGTGLVEDYKGDFAGLSTLTKAQVMGAVLASEFRWLVNPAGMTKPEDFEQSANGAAIPGVEGDVSLVQSGKSGDLQITMQMSGEYVNRIGRGFLLGSTMVRDAERVTQEEIRLIANELETSLGGAYSRLAVDMQLPIAHWCMVGAGIKIGGKGFVPTVLTGLDALSRSADGDDIKLWLQDMAALATLPPALQARLKMDDLAVDLGAARRVSVTKYLKSATEVQQDQANAQAQNATQVATEEGIKAMAGAAADNATQPQG
jgi:hypothetical protein